MIRHWIFFLLWLAGACAFAWLTKEFAIAEHWFRCLGSFIACVACAHRAWFHDRQIEERL